MASKYLYRVEAKPIGGNGTSWVLHYASERAAKAEGAKWDVERFRVSMYRYVKTAWPAQRQSVSSSEKKT